MSKAETHFKDGSLHVEEVSLADIAAAVGTPTYVYSAGKMRAQFAELKTAFEGIDQRIYYSVKASSNLAVMDLFRQCGAGFDIVSGGELSRVLTINADPGDVIFAGVGKSIAEIDFALKTEIGCFNIESAAELDRIIARAELLGRVAPISVRVNPNIDPQTHPYISTGLKENKFGVSKAVALSLYQQAEQSSATRVIGIDCHIGSQLGDIQPSLDALAFLLKFVSELGSTGITIEHLDLGGGFGVTYADEKPFDLATFGAKVKALMQNQSLQLRFEPGRFLTANAGLLLTQVEYLKEAPDADSKNFVVIDAAMNDLLRPALYQAWHDVVPVNASESGEREWDIVGPVCESADFLAKNRRLQTQPGSLLAVLDAGAYGMSLASNYNTRGRAAEVMVEGDQFRVIRRRETFRDLVALESW